MPTSTPATPELLFKNVTFNKCLATFSPITFPGNTGPGTPPANWSAGEYRGVGSDLYVELIDCQRVSWGPFERPVSFMLEFTNKLVPPPKCADGDWDFIYALQSAIVSDSEFAAFINKTYGGPFRFGAVSHEGFTRNGIQTLNWTWAWPGGLMSSLQTTSSDYQHGPADIRDRFVWTRQSGVVLFDYSESYVSTGVRGQIGTGTMNPPMLYYATLGTNSYVSRAEIFLSDEATAKIQTFEDSQCEHPV